LLLDTADIDFVIYAATLLRFAVDAEPLTLPRCCLLLFSITSYFDYFMLRLISAAIT